MAVTLSPLAGAGWQFFDNNGVPLAGGLLYSYYAGTSTFAPTYTSYLGNIQNSNPIVLDSSGRVTSEIWLTYAVGYKFVLQTASGVQIWSYDNIPTNTPIPFPNDAANISYEEGYTVTAGSFVIGSTYLISSIGSTDFTAIGASANQTGTYFTATGVGSGTGTAKLSRSVQSKLQESVSIEDFGASPSNTAAQNATALLAAEAAGFNYIYVPPGTFNVTGSTALTKKYVGPGVLNFSGIGAISFAGSGVNDLTLTGSFTQSEPLQMVIKIIAINQTGITGAPSPCDVYEYSLNGGVTWITTYGAYNPADDQVYTVQFGCNANVAYSSPAVPLGLGGTGVVAVFGSATGHTVGNSWAFTLTPNPQIVETHSGVITQNGVPIAGVSGVNGQNAFLGTGVFGNLNNAGGQLTAIGYKVLQDNTSGYANTAGGIYSMQNNTTGFNNTAWGGNSLYQNTSGTDNAAFGLYSLQSNLSGSGNVGCGSDSGGYNQDGDGNTSVGTQAMYQNTHGTENAAFGRYSLRGGTESFGNGTSQSYCTGIGAYSLYFGGGLFNTGLGHQAGYNNTGNYNTYLGAISGSTANQISGSYNVFIGYQSGQSASQTNTVNNCIAIGDNSYTTGSNAVAIGSGVNAPTNTVVIGNSLHGYVQPSTDAATNLGASSKRWNTVYAATGTINTSDGNQKTVIGSLNEKEQAVAKTIKGLFKTFQFNSAIAKKGASEARIHVGVIAQDVQAAFIAQGLDPTRYALFCSDTWYTYNNEVVEVDSNEMYEQTVYQVNGITVQPNEKNNYPENATKVTNLLPTTKVTQLGIRYDELLAFVISAI